MYKNLEILSNISEDVEKWGGKAVGLYLLKKNGFLVPKTLVLSSDYYCDYVIGKDNSAIIDSELSVMISKYFDSNKIIFRSSANVENAEFFSSPGVFESFDAVPSTQPYILVKSVWDSSLDDCAKSYYKLEGIADQRVKMGVVIQELIEGQLGIVLHSYDIIRGNPNVVIEFTSGKTSDIVDGKANAESIVVDHSGRVIASTSIAPQLTSVKIQELVDAAEKMEYLLGSHVEMEIQVYNQTLYFLQVRKLL